MGRNKGCGWGRVPDNQELIALVEKLSEGHYAGRYLPGMAMFDDHRPFGWRRAQAICRAHDCPGSAEGWRRLMQRLGLSTPVAPNGAALGASMRALRGEQALDAPLEETPPAGRRRGRERWFSHGLPVIERQRPVRAWCWRSKRYVVVGHRRVWEVR